MTNQITCAYLDCNNPRQTSWGWITASNNLDELKFCNQDHYDRWSEKNAGNFWDIKGLGSDDIKYGPRTKKIENEDKIEYVCRLSPHIIEENKQSIIQSIMSQFQGYNLNPTIVAPQDSNVFTVTIDNGDMPTSEVKTKLLNNYFVDQVSSRSDTKVVKNFHINLNKDASVNGQGYDAPVTSYLDAPGAQDPEGPQYIIDQANITGPQIEASKWYEKDNND